MSDEAKLDTLVTALADVRVAISDVAGDTKAILGRLDAHDDARRDHEARLRTLEGYKTADHEQRITSLERWRWVLTGAAAAAGGGVGAGITAALKIGT